MIGYCSPESLGFRLCVFFAANPDEELLSEDLRIKFDAPKLAYRNIRASVKSGLIKCEGRGVNSKYTAGPALLQLIGEKA